MLYAALAITNLSACHRNDAPLVTVASAGETVILARSTSQFVYRDHGPLVREYRLFGVNPNPFGENNRDEYVASFGVPLMTTHMLVVNDRDVNAATHARANCEREAAADGMRVVVITDNAQAREALDQMNGDGGRVCARLSGRDLEFQDWRLNNASQPKDIIDRMTMKQGGFDFNVPFLVQKVEPIPCG